MYNVSVRGHPPLPPTRGVFRMGAHPPKASFPKNFPSPYFVLRWSILHASGLAAIIRSTSALLSSAKVSDSQKRRRAPPLHPPPRNRAARIP
ncbi:hypothetical protein CDAR_578721 [Caerostris darwini]|uniref:Uncharacterized protein n=1 Tax=Caerostris darwini TaxID=1538125 RepID=A0AAV4UC15_9ARAC|nr:hypothetical protein CDAR_578721 [Caerostris darwini]